MKAAHAAATFAVDSALPMAAVTLAPAALLSSVVAGVSLVGLPAIGALTA